MPTEVDNVVDPSQQVIRRDQILKVQGIEESILLADRVQCA